MKKYFLIISLLFIISGCNFAQQNVINEKNTNTASQNTNSFENLDTDISLNEDEEEMNEQDLYAKEIKEEANKTANSITYSKKYFAGNWEGSMEYEFNGQKATSYLLLTIEINDDGIATGDFVSTLRLDKPNTMQTPISTSGELFGQIQKEMVAPYYFEKYYDSISLILDWEGTRSDFGRATVVYDESNNALIWGTHIFESDDYTVPKNIKLFAVGNVVR